MTDYVTLAGGCFWCTEAVFKDVIGVESVESGYIGGHVPDPTYKQVCGGDTGHAEAIRIGFDPEQLKLGDLLDIFFATHDATTLNRQGNDVGTQYRSAMFPMDDSQRSHRPTAPSRSSRRSRRRRMRSRRPGTRPRAITRIIGKRRAARTPIAWR
jgi:peptide-methionine (S)-S-oxide reductase